MSQHEFVDIIAGLAVLILLARSSIQFLGKDERLVIIRLARAVGVRGPGLTFVLPLLEIAKKVDLSVRTLSIPAQNLVTKDDFPIEATVKFQLQVVDPFSVVTQIPDLETASNQVILSALQRVLSSRDLNELDSIKDTINAKMQIIIDNQVQGWGINLSCIEVSDISRRLPSGTASIRQAKKTATNSEKHPGCPEKSRKIMRVSGSVCSIT